jgi:N-acyl homoserine lactone hydrolase
VGLRAGSVRRVDFGYFVRPAAETATGLPRAQPCLGYLVPCGEGVLLVDTGMGSHPDVDAHYRPVRRPFDTALARAGVRREDVRMIVNCHLHFDHCGANPELAGRPVFVQRAELHAARSEGYTLPELVEDPRIRYEVLDGDAELFSGVIVVPTPGHTEGHQSVVVSCGDGTVVVAGQSHTSASEFGSDMLGARARDGERLHDLPVLPQWIDRLARLDPRRVVFAHDHAVWEP